MRASTRPNQTPEGLKTPIPLHPLAKPKPRLYVPGLAPEWDGAVRAIVRDHKRRSVA